MNFIKRGALNVTRRIGKSFILLFIIFILGNVIAGAISIQQATSNVERTIKERIGTAATLEIDYQKLDSMSEQEMMEVDWTPIGRDLIRQIGELSYVKYYDYSSSTWLGSDDIQSYEGGMEVHYGDSYNPRFQLKGINYARVLDFEEGRGQLVDGRVFTDDEIENGASVAIISKKLAEENNLHVGDTFALTNKVFDYSAGEEEEIASRDVVLEIIGLFEPQSVAENDGENSDRGMWDWMDIEYQNTVYVSNQVVREENQFHMEAYMAIDEEYAQMIENEEIHEHFSPIFILHSTDVAEAFAEEAMPLIPQLYTVRNVSDHFDNIAGPIKSMATLSGYVLIVSIVASVLIIGLVVLLFLRDRKRELGIYLSLGERRSRVVGQVLLEVMIVAIIGITLSLFTGNLLASGVSDTMMKSDTNQQYQDYYFYGGELHSNLTTDDVIESYQVHLNATYIMMFLVIGLLTILVSTVIPLIYIVRLNPKKILM
ncbi:putative ABC transport system permease protein [Evansella vedderi]|uniref:ABC transport system permease protein n=1 Tax=Evansella vedderi TaxID=38282 RepID=A0ABT9ZXK2_9BACI|nr:ABC transporter permease [Evansella vedderi]MDQ0255966.1 putative ABC transport system permease protein [Evansella vedderi]